MNHSSDRDREIQDAIVAAEAAKRRAGVSGQPAAPEPFADTLARLAASVAKTPSRCRDCQAEIQYPGVCEACAAKHEARELERRLAETIPARFRWARIDAPELRARLRRPEALEEARAAMREPLVVLTGTAGSGKTSLAAAMLRGWNAAHPHDMGRFDSAWRLGMARARHPLGEGEPEDVNRAMAGRLLVLDDLGSERQMHNSAVPDVIFSRHDEDRATWITTGLTTRQVIERYGEGFARRVFEGARIIACEEPKP